MDLKSKIIQSFSQQGVLGESVMRVIGILAVSAIILVPVVSYSYNKLKRAFLKSEEINEKGERNLINDKLKKIESEFKKSAKSGTENINTEVIIQKNMGSVIMWFERIIKIIPSMCIGLGLIGTFLGLTIAIVDTSGVLGSGITSMDQFSLNMNGPLSSMSSAFWTSIAGVGASIILNGVSLISENSKEAFYDCLEDYLDNVIYGIYAQNFNSLFKEFNETIKGTMLTLASDMRGLFQDGVKELVDKINKNSIDLTSTVKGLTAYTKDLERLTMTLNTSVENFKEPVEKFKVSVFDFTDLMKGISLDMKESFDKFAMKAEMLEENLGRLYSGIHENRTEFKSICDAMKNEAGHLTSANEEMMKSLERVSASQGKNSEEISNEISKLNKVYSTFNMTMIEFEARFKELPENISSDLTTALGKQMNEFSNGIIGKLDNSLYEVASTVEKLSENSANVGRLIKATNEWVAVSKDTNKEI